MGLAQPKVRGEAYVDYSANSEKVKITIWFPKTPGELIEICSHDEVEVRTIRRTMTYHWDTCEEFMDELKERR